MRKYTNPELEIVLTHSDDVITTSPGTETGIVDEDNGIWDLEI